MELSIKHVVAHLSGGRILASRFAVGRFEGLRRSGIAADDTSIAGKSAGVYARLRETRMPSFCMRDGSVDRFNPSREAAPSGPATTQSLFSKAARICWRSASSSASRILPEGAAARLDAGVAGAVAGAPFGERRSSLRTVRNRPG